MPYNFPGLSEYKLNKLTCHGNMYVLSKKQSNHYAFTSLTVIC